MIFELGNKRLTGDGKYWIAPSANVIGDVTLKNDSSIWFNVVIRGDIENITSNISTLVLTPNKSILFFFAYDFNCGTVFFF